MRGRAGGQITVKNLDVQPTLTVRPGWTLRAVIHKDLVLRRGRGEMADPKLARLPDRIPVKIAISVSPELNAVLADYARLYEETYGQAEPVPELIPAMLAAFTEHDRALTRGRRSAAGRADQGD